MSESQPSSIDAAFEFLLEELEIELACVSAVSCRRVSAHDYDDTRGALDVALTLNGFRDEVLALRQKWNGLAERVRRGEQSLGITLDWCVPGRLKRGMRTPMEAFFDPILNAIKELGGVAHTDEILATVSATLGPNLDEADRESIAPRMQTARWRNTFDWARQAMVRDGLLKGDTAPDMWEMTETGAWQQAHAELQAKTQARTGAT